MDSLASAKSKRVLAICEIVANLSSEPWTAIENFKVESEMFMFYYLNKGVKDSGK